MITNTTEQVKDPLFAALAIALGSSGIEASERRGQQELLKTDVIPVDGSTRTEDVEALTAIGFVLGGLVDGDKLFRNCTLPVGWKKKGSDHDMWSYIHDEQDRCRVAVFYKAAFYDRSAHMSLERRYRTTTKIATGPGLVHVTEDYGAYTHRIACVCDCDGTVLFSLPGVLSRDYAAERVANEAAIKWLKETYPECNNPAAYW